MEESPQWLNMIPKDREWHARESKRRHGVSEDKKLELRLGPPGEDRSLLSLSYLPSMASITHLHTNSHGAKRGFQDTLEAKPWPRVSLSSSSSAFEKQNHQPKSSYLQYPVVPQTLGAIVDESSKPRPTSMADQAQQYKDKMACSVAADASVSANTAVPNSSQKRIEHAPVVGWPPIRSFRKNLVNSSSSKPESESPNKIPEETGYGKSESSKTGLFVKINMDGVPIGRKVDLKACDSYEKLSYAVDDLFRGLLSAQNESSAGTGNENKMEEAKTMAGLFDGSGEYTLVYEDNEGDRMLVGDVPWHMFVSTVRRLRVLKSSELAILCVSSSKQEKPPPGSAVEFGK
ncbi:hypothetical protein VitviT2T_004356 [Vitis vinifera]|uniref:Auxin-responsive protein n=2 Tax=Vitis vinifera TaxID=29760 RepID=A0ABY9BP82_VITVI|nr:auxin-responsive protein IAA2 [Vitis vinifera]XP_010648285.1 auxin-responsive protein IAA2 [Vitis vinifera]WJZ84765.1 hypothetical protein VitviT2T_004356 [Vitis vinifera]|eukprot:XP_002277798.1 PREDICTED: auxin-responsive protein IAA2 [Vitis vinifera]